MYALEVINAINDHEAHRGVPFVPFDYDEIAYSAFPEYPAVEDVPAGWELAMLWPVAVVERKVSSGGQLYPWPRDWEHTREGVARYIFNNGHGLTKTYGLGLFYPVKDRVQIALFKKVIEERIAA